MSKNPKRSRHNVPAAYFTTPDEITPEYQAEIDATMERAERAYEKAKKHLEATERRKQRALARKERAEQQAANAAQKKKAIVEYERRLAEYEAAYKEFVKLDSTVRSSPNPPSDNRANRAFVTSGKTDPRAKAQKTGVGGNHNR